MSSKFSIGEAFTIYMSLHKHMPEEVANSIFEKVKANTDMSRPTPDTPKPRGRPRKAESVDTVRARVIDGLNGDTVDDRIEEVRLLASLPSRVQRGQIPREWFDEEAWNNLLHDDGALAKLFPDQDLKSSISRGRKNLKLDGEDCD